MVIFHSYVSLPEGKSGGKNLGKLGEIYIYIMGISWGYVFGED